MKAIRPTKPMLYSAIPVINKQFDIAKGRFATGGDMYQHVTNGDFVIETMTVVHDWIFYPDVGRFIASPTDPTPEVPYQYDDSKNLEGRYFEWIIKDNISMADALLDGDIQLQGTTQQGNAGNNADTFLPTKYNPTGKVKVDDWVTVTNNNMLKGKYYKVLEVRTDGVVIDSGFRQIGKPLFRSSIIKL